MQIPIELREEPAINLLEEHRAGVLNIKAKEYNLSDNRLQNFRDGAKLFSDLAGKTISMSEYLIVTFIMFF